LGKLRIVVNNEDIFHAVALKAHTPTPNLIASRFASPVPIRLQSTL
jgi:hypothetical protein